MVDESIRTFREDNVVFVKLDLFKCQSSEDFYRLLVKEVLLATHSKLEELMAFLSKGFKNLLPFIQFEAMDGPGFSLGFEWKDHINEDEIINLPEKVAKKKGVRIVMCLDEFQNIQHFKDPVGFQKKLRANWQHHRGVHYLFYGSKRHLMVQLFESSEMPFYRFGHVLYLQKIASLDWTSFLVRKFRYSKKRLSAELAMKIVEEMDSNSYYVQHLSFLVWYATQEEVTPKIIQQCKETLVNNLAPQFALQVEGLSRYQINLLKAIASGQEKLTSIQTVKSYDLGTGATVIRSKDSLVEKDILIQEIGGLEFSDPAFKIWFSDTFLDH